MKRLYSYIFALMAALLMAACSDDLGVEKGNSTTGGLRFAIPTWKDNDVETRAGVTSEDIGIKEGSMQLLCFDKDGFYLGMGDGTTITPETDFKGSITAKVPTGTCRIHFIANAKLKNNAKWIGLNENTLIASLTSTEDDDMVYWGYKRCATVDEMKAFLESDDEVLMLRNEAKVSVVNESEKGSTDEIKDIYLTVCEDLKYGTLAPFNYSDLDNPFDYDEESNTPVTLPEDVTQRTSPTDVDSDTEQFIFEASNSQKQPIKVVLKVTYADGKQKYHQIQLRDNSFELHKIRRNHNYEIHIKKLDKDLGYDTFDGAVNGSPSNSPSASVDDVVPEVSKDDYTLRIVGSTSRLYNDTGDKTVQFQFLGDDTMTESNFKVEWSENNGISPTESLVFDYDNTSQTGTITFPIDKLTGSLQSGVILIRDTKYGLERNVHIYAVSKLNFNGAVKGTGTAETKTVHNVTTEEIEKEVTLTLDSETGLAYTPREITDWWGGTSYSYSAQYIEFTFSGDEDVTKDDFEIESYSGCVTYSDWGRTYKPSVYSYSNGTGSIYVPITGPTNSNSRSVSEGYLVLKNTKYNMTRTIKVYTAMKESYVTADLTKAAPTTTTATITTTVIVSEEDVEMTKYSSYELTFTIPDDFPDDLLPIKVKIATDELQPDNSKNQLDVVVESTKEIGKDWNYWYVFTADKTDEEKGKDKTYTIYMTPIRADEYDKGTVYLKTDYFNIGEVVVPYTQ